MPLLYSRISLGGRIVNWRTYQMLKAAADLLGVRSIPLTQGSYNGDVALSGGTHDGGGVIDAPAWIDGKSPWRIAWALRVVGFAAWYRTRAEGPWGEHIHAVAIGDKQLSRSASAQVGAYYRGEDGLFGPGRDSGPRIEPIRVWEAVKALPPVVVESVIWASNHPDKKLYRRQVRRVQRALKMKTRTGICGPWTKRRWRNRFGSNAVTRDRLATLSVGKYHLIDRAPE